MSELSYVIVVVLLVSVILISQIKTITTRLDDEEKKPKVLQDKSKYNDFANIIDKEILSIKNDLENEKIKLISEDKQDEVLELFANTTKELVMFETGSFKTQKQLEAELFYILEKIDICLKNNFENGKDIAENLKDKLLQEFKNIL